jgi:hypothetical protein
MPYMMLPKNTFLLSLVTNFFFFFAVLEFELRAYILSHSTNLTFVISFFQDRAS